MCSKHARLPSDASDVPKIVLAAGRLCKQLCGERVGVRLSRWIDTLRVLQEEALQSREGTRRREVGERMDRMLAPRWRWR